MHTLQAFSEHALALQVRAAIRWRVDGVDLRFEVADPGRLIVDGPVPAHYERSLLKRADELWKTTCFEAFWGRPSQPEYYELNLSANTGRWNLYRFADYRRPQPPQASHDFDLQEISITPSSVSARLSGPGGPFEANLCAVLKTAAQTHYYASFHPGPQADFHLREGFVLKS